MDLETTLFSSEDFLDDVRHAIRQRFRNQSEFAKLIPVSRNVISRIVNDPDGLNIEWINRFAKLLGLDLRDYIV